MWEGLFPAEQARIVHLIVDWVEIGPSGADMRLKLDGWAVWHFTRRSPPR